MIDELVRKLAEARRVEAEYKEKYAALKAEIDAVVEERYGKRLGLLESFLETAGQDLADADEALRAAAVKQYETTGEKRVHAGVTVKMFTTLQYEEGDALAYSMEHLPGALKLNKREFEKAARVLEPKFVVFEVEPRATIARDLSAYTD